MKRILFILFSVLLITSQLKAEGYNGEVIFENRAFEEREGFLHLNFDIHVGASAVTKCTGMRVFPELIADDDNVFYFPYIEVVGRNRGKMNKRRYKLIGKRKMADYQYPYMLVNVKANTDTLLNYEMKVPFQEWMREGRLILRQELCGCRNEHRLYTQLLADRLGESSGQQRYASGYGTGFGIGSESASDFVPVYNEPKPARGSAVAQKKDFGFDPSSVNAAIALITPEFEEKIRDVQGRANLDFPVGRTDVQPNFKNNGQELRKIRETLTNISENPDVVKITGLSITGYASPEGSYEMNDRLAKGRMSALRDYVVRNYRLPLNGAPVEINSVAEDWDGLKKLLEESYIPYKEEALNIIEFYDIWSGREKYLMDLAGGVPYRAMLKELFPQLRRVEYQIDYIVRDYTLEEIKALVGKKDKYLSQFELFLAAESFGKESPKYRQIFLDIIPRYYGDNQAANNNAAALLLESGELNAAQRYIDKAGNLPEALNNRGVLSMKRGDFDRAEQLLNSAYAQGVKEAGYNLAELKRLRAAKK